MNTFDEIMQYCPFLKKVIEDKIAEEISTRDTKISELESELSLLKESNITQ